MSHAFQVDLRGVVDLLSHHLYASPRVFVRELLQNAVDAITARRAVEPNAPAVVRIDPASVTGDGTLRITDTGIGLTEVQVHELLATIGRSSKRDELGFVRHVEGRAQVRDPVLVQAALEARIEIERVAEDRVPGQRVRGGIRYPERSRK